MGPVWAQLGLGVNIPRWIILGLKIREAITAIYNGASNGISRIFLGGMIGVHIGFQFVQVQSLGMKLLTYKLRPSEDLKALERFVDELIAIKAGQTARLRDAKSALDEFILCMSKYGYVNYDIRFLFLRSSGVIHNPG